MVTVGEREDTRTNYFHFLVVPYRSIYNFLIGMPFIVILDAVASLVQVNLKYHNVHDEMVMINVELSRAEMINKPLHQYQNEGKGIDIEINIASLVKKF